MWKKRCAYITVDQCFPLHPQQTTMPSRPNSSDHLDRLLQGQEGRLAQRKRRFSESSDSEAGENGVASSASSSDREESKQPGFLQDWNGDPENGSTESPNDREKSSIVVDDRFTSLRRITKKSGPSNQSSLTTAQATFASLGVSLPLQKALKGMSIKVPTEVQAACVPPLLAGKCVPAYWKCRNLHPIVNRPRLHWKCKDRLWQNYCVCLADFTTTVY